jgi:hypothetical protein
MSARKKTPVVQVSDPSPRITRSHKEFLVDDIDDDNLDSPDGRRKDRKSMKTASTPSKSEFSDDSLLDTDNTDAYDEDVSARHHSINGFTENGDKFTVPPTRDTLAMLKRVSELPTLITWACIAFTIYVALPQSLLGVPVLARYGIEGYPRHYLLYVAVFWRLMYNITIAYILDFQSRTKGLTNYVRGVSKRKGSIAYNVLSMLLRGNLGFDSLEEKPAEFNAWVLNTQLVNVILPNDVFAFVLFAVLEMNIPGYEYMNILLFFN